MTRRVQVFDTTLRDGEQSPGFGLTAEQKLEVARQICRLGVDVIEAGFPAASPGDFQAVKQIAQTIEGPIIAALARADKMEIDAVHQAMKLCKRQPRVHIVLTTSPVHMAQKLRKGPGEVVQMARDAVAYAHSLGFSVQFSAVDATRSDPAFLTQILTVAVRAGARILNIPDTVGYTTPKEYHDLFRHLIEHVDAPEGVTFSAHCHNDLGMAVANTVAALEAGASQFECTVNGIGDRAGNAALEEVVMALAARADRFGMVTGIQTKEIYRTSRLVQSLTGVAVQPNKAIVGANAFAYGSGIRHNGLPNNRNAYELMRAEDVGVPANSPPFGKHSGRHAFRHRLEQLGYQLTEEQIDRAFTRFKELADRKTAITELDLGAIVSDEQAAAPELQLWSIDSFQVISGNVSLPSATVRLTHKNGTSKMEAAHGDGPVDALFKAVDRATEFGGELLEYWSKAVTGGRDALGEVTVLVTRGGHAASGRAASTDLIEASARAYLSAINKILSGATVLLSDEPAPGWQMKAWGD